MAAHADVLKGFVTRSCPTNVVRGTGTVDEPPKNVCVGG